MSGRKKKGKRAKTTKTKSETEEEASQRSLDDLNKNFREVSFESFEDPLKDPIFKNRPDLDLLVKLHLHAACEAMRKMAHLCRNNPTKPSYKNPPNRGPEKKNDDPWIRIIAERAFIDGLELPGNRHNPLGMPYFSDFFMDMFFGNYTEFMQHIDKMSPKELKKALQCREGSWQYSPLFAPIEGLRMLETDYDPTLSEKARKEIKFLFNGTNEGKHVEILEKLLELGADPNASDIDGYTPLHHAAKPENYPIRRKMIKALLNHGADANAQNRFGDSVISTPLKSPMEGIILIMDLVLRTNNRAIVTDKKDINKIRTAAEINLRPMHFVGYIRQFFHRGPNECERCEVYAVKKCSTCKYVHYCSPDCQKQDWKYHKGTCAEKKEALKNQVPN